MNIQPFPKLTHLGDLVNIIQHYCTIADYIYTDDLQAREMIEFLLSLLDVKLKSCQTKPNQIEFVAPTWTFSQPNEFGTMFWHPRSYKKSTNLPQKQDSHIVCQFDARANVQTITEEDIFNICKTIGVIHNIGDRKFEFTINHNQCSLNEKYQLLNSAHAYIGIDSGLSHLALMSNTPTYILYKKNNPWFFYPDEAITIECENFFKIIEKIL